MEQQQQHLDALEHGLLMAASDVKMHGMMARGCAESMTSLEEQLGDLLCEVLALKAELGVPTKLIIVKK
jgi:hypothetical protein